MMTANLHRLPRNKRLFVWLCLATGVALLAIAPCAALAAVSLMAMGAERSVGASVLFWTIWTFPIVLVAGPGLAWIAYGLRRERTALGLSLSPMAWAAAIGAWFSLFS
ncbi:hypothetical protein [Brevundimonas sp.]|uniref:hypothetical protein n=1 Tax=Brevundimonas sp. TaxID=1871086 RepID=UPI003BA97A11